MIKIYIMEEQKMLTIEEVKAMSKAELIKLEDELLEKIIKKILAK